VTREIIVLVVDDQKSVREGTRALLASARGIDATREACTGQEAVQLVAEEQPDMVLMDVLMPVMDGLEATRQIKERWPRVKVIVITMYPSYRTEALAAGADRFLLKGRMGELLEGTIRSLAAESDADDISLTTRSSHGGP
jgi:DNA-binding NarL/FixJ family response regulator